MLYPSDTVIPLIDCDHEMRSCFNHIVARDVSDDEWEQAKLPTRHGGCGLTDPLLIRPAAAMASARATALLLVKAHQHSNLSIFDDMLIALKSQSHVKQAAITLNAAAIDVGATTDTFLPPLNALHSSVNCPSQRDMSGVLHLQRQRKLLDKLMRVDRQKAAWLRSCASFGSGSWLHSVPSIEAFQCDKEEFRMMLMIRLGIKQCHATPQEIPRCACSAVHSQRIASGSHYHTSCNAVAKQRNDRHHAFRNLVYKMCQEAGLKPRHRYNHEPAGLAGGSSNARPADVLVPPSAARNNGLDRALDTVVCDPQAAASIEGKSYLKALVATQLAGKQKMDEFEAHRNAVGPGVVSVDKVPLSVESSGAWGKELRALWKELKSLHRSNNNESYIRQGKPHTWSAFTFAQHWPQRISFMINRTTARMVMDGLKASRIFLSTA